MGYHISNIQPMPSCSSPSYASESQTNFDIKEQKH